MRSIERLFKQIEKDNPDWSTWTCFTMTIIGKNFSKDRIARHFNSLVDKEDYEQDEKRQLLNYLYSVTRDGSKKYVKRT